MSKKNELANLKPILGTNHALGTIHAVKILYMALMITSFKNGGIAKHFSKNFWRYNRLCQHVPTRPLSGIFKIT